MTSRLACVLFVTSLAACGSDNKTTTDAGNGSGSGSAAAMITITGTAKTVGAGSSSPAPGVTIGAYRNSDENTPVATATTDTAGAYTLTIMTNGQALDGFLKATLTGDLDTYLYPPAPLTADFSGAAINMVTENTVQLLSNVCGHGITEANGVIGVEVFDASMQPVAGASLSSTPAAAKYCFDGATPGLPDGAKTETAADGLGYMIDVSGSVMVSASKSGTTFKSHSVKVRVGTLTTTLITP